MLTVALQWAVKMDQFWKWTNSLMILSIVILCKIHVDEKHK